MKVLSLYCGGGGIDELEIEELAQLQGFPKEYKFVGSKSSKIRQIGNAVPPNVIRYITLSRKCN